MKNSKYYKISNKKLDMYYNNYPKNKSKVAVSEAIQFCKDTLDDLEYQKLPLLTYCMKFTKCYVKTLENCMNLIKL